MRAVAFDLLSEQEKTQAAEDLNRLVTEKDYHLNTGFLSTPFLCQVLAQYGYLNSAGKALKEGGIGLLYHNHNCEFRKVRKGKTAYQLLLEETDPSFVNFEFDSYWPTEAGVNALALMRQLGNRLKLYHINDRGSRVSGPSMTPILQSDSMELGYGNMDLVSLVEQAKSVGVDAVIYRLAMAATWIPMLASLMVQT